MRCDACGFVNPTSSKQCERCGESLLEHSALSEASQGVTRNTAPEPQAKLHSSPVQSEQDASTTARAAQPNPVRTAAPALSVVQGYVSGFQERAETNLAKEQEHVWSFRVDVYDKSGDLVQRYPVEMRSQSLSGVLRDGDLVELDVSRRKNGVLTPKRIRNLSMGGADVGENWRRTLAKWVFFAVFALVGVFVIYEWVSPKDDRCFEQKSEVERLEWEAKSLRESQERGFRGLGQDRQGVQRELTKARQALKTCLGK